MVSRQADAPVLLTLAEAAEALRIPDVDERYMKRLIREKQIEHVRVRRTWLLTYAQLADLQEALTCSPSARGVPVVPGTSVGRSGRGRTSGRSTSILRERVDAMLQRNTDPSSKPTRGRKYSTGLRVASGE